MHNIIAATDGSPCADRAVDVAVRVAKVTGAALLILTVGGSVPGEELRQIAKAEGGKPEALDLLVNAILQQASKRAAASGVDNIRMQTAWGDPEEMIIETARRERADAIVVGRRGRGRLTGLLLGSVSQKLVVLAPCMVIVVP